MSRSKRIDLPNYFYHVYARGQRKNPIFFTDHDMEIFEDIVYKSLNKFDYAIVNYSLMRTHYHFQIYRNNDKLSRIFHWVDTMYALYFNKTYRLVGHVFQGRFQSKIILNDIYNYDLFFYIMNNAHKAGYVKNGKIYKFSGEGFYLKGEPNKLITMPLLNVKDFKNFSINKEIFKSPYYIGLESDLEKNVEVKEEYNRLFFNKDHNNSISKILKLLLSHYKINYETFVSKNKNRKLVKIRNKIIMCLYCKYGFSSIQIGNAINMSFQNVSKIIKKGFQKGEKGEGCP